MPRRGIAKPTVAGKPYSRRLTISISEELHQRIRVSAAIRGTTMEQEARAVLEAAHWEKVPAARADRPRG
jgi:plasmid stability protein